jgi:phage shock protein A
MIDQATYDAAMSASPGGVLRQKQVESANTARSSFEAVKRNIDQLYDAQSGSLKPAAQSLFGQYAQYRPEMSMSQESVDAKLALEGLTDQVMMANLADAKARVGQSFGSMQVQEWDKFTQQLTSLKRGLSEKQAAESMKYVLNFIKTKGNVLETALSKPNTVSPPATKPQAASDFNSKWAALKSGQSLVGPDGKTYTKK